MSDALIPHTVIADQLGLTVGSLAQMRYLGTGPRYVKVGRQIRYRQSDIDEWIEANVRTQTGQRTA